MFQLEIMSDLIHFNILPILIFFTFLLSDISCKTYFIFISSYVEEKPLSGFVHHRILYIECFLFYFNLFIFFTYIECWPTVHCSTTHFDVSSSIHFLLQMTIEIALNAYAWGCSGHAQVILTYQALYNMSKSIPMHMHFNCTVCVVC